MWADTFNKKLRAPFALLIWISNNYSICISVDFADSFLSRHFFPLPNGLQDDLGETAETSRTRHEWAHSGPSMLLCVEKHKTAVLHMIVYDNEPRENSHKSCLARLQKIDEVVVVVQSLPLLSPLSLAPRLIDWLEMRWKLISKTRKRANPL